jgi:hypothetical protein
VAEAAIIEAAGVVIVVLVMVVPVVPVVPVVAVLWPSWGYGVGGSSARVCTEATTTGTIY